jgi:hypothetical protein
LRGDAVSNLLLAGFASQTPNSFGGKEVGMSYDEGLAQRMRVQLGPLPGLTEKKMFGGIAFLLRGNMACGIHGDDLIVRVGPQRYQAALAQAHARPFYLTGRPMSGWIAVQPPGYEADHDLTWIGQAVACARSLPAR